MPGSVPPEGMVLISCQEHVDRMMEVLQGIKKCELYLVRNYPSSDENDDDMGGLVAYITSFFIFQVFLSHIYTYLSMILNRIHMRMSHT